MKPLCVVTGTSSGIGQTLARMLVERGWEVVGVARRPAALAGPNYRHISLDLSDVERVQRYFETTFVEHTTLAGRPRVGLVNNAGVVGPIGSPQSFSAGDFSRSLNLNVVAPVWLTGFFSKACADAPLTVVNVSSGAAFRPIPGWSAYCAGKAALRMAGRVFGKDVERAEIFRGRVGSLAVVNYSPGVVDTAMQGEVRQAPVSAFPGLQRFINFHEQGKLKSTEIPAAEICALLDREDLPPYSERGYGK